jgi:hypothetical protein
VESEAIRVSIDTQKKSPKTITDTREHLKEELGLIIQGGEKMTKTIINTSQRGIEAKMQEVEDRAKRGRGRGAGTVKPPKFYGATSWAVRRWQFETAAEHNCGCAWRNPHA